MHITVKNSRGYTVLYPAHGPRYDKKSLRIEQVHLTRHTSVPKVRTPNPNSKTKKQKAFDQAYLEWTMEHFAKYDNCPSVKEYKKWLWEQKLANSSKFTSPVSPGDTIGYWASDSNELKWVTIKPDELIIKSAYDKDVALKDKDGFIPWNGGEMPVPMGAVVHVKLRSGKEVICTAGYHPSSKQFKRLSDNWLYANDWSHDNEPGDIVAYRVHEEDDVYTKLQQDVDNLKKSHSFFNVYNSPIKTTYTFWLGANGEIVDDK